MASAIIIEAGNPNFIGMRGTIAQQGKPRSDINLVLSKIKGVDSHDRTPETWDNSASKNDGKGPRYAKKKLESVLPLQAKTPDRKQA